MVGLGMLLLFNGLYGVFALWQGRLQERRWFLRVLLFSAPAGFVAIITGWITAEVGRQPYTVYGLLTTAESASPITASAVGTSLILFVFVYGIVFGAGLHYIIKLIRRGPDPETGPRAAPAGGPEPGHEPPLGREAPQESQS